MKDNKESVPGTNGTKFWLDFADWEASFGRNIHNKRPMRSIEHTGGRHRYNEWIKDLPKRLKYGVPKHMHIELVFTNSCVYKEENVPYSGINKIFGFTMGLHGEKMFGRLFPNCVNSFLLGWQPAFDINRKYPTLHPANKIDLFTYEDKMGEEVRKKIGSVPINTKITMDMILVEHKDNIATYKVIFEGISIAIIVRVHTNVKLGYYLMPYFGGKSTAPFDMNYLLRVRIKYNDNFKYIL